MYARYKTPADSDFQDTNRYNVAPIQKPRNGADGMAISRKGIPDGSPRLVPRKASARSRVSNGADILPDVDGRSAVVGATAILPRKSSPTWAVRRNAPKHAFNSFAASRLQPFLPSRWKHDWQMASRSTSQIMHCCHR